MPLVQLKGLSGYLSLEQKQELMQLSPSKERGCGP